MGSGGELGRQRLRDPCLPVRSARLRVSVLLLAEQALNGVQLGIMLLLMAAGLTLVLGIMNLVNLAHGSLYMDGAYPPTGAYQWPGSFLASVPLALPATLRPGIAVAVAARRTLDGRDHLGRGLASF